MYMHFSIFLSFLWCPLLLRIKHWILHEVVPNYSSKSLFPVPLMYYISRTIDFSFGCRALLTSLPGGPCKWVSFRSISKSLS